MDNMKKYIYGPVPSRRLGFSLGVDTIPYKTCSFDCVYCQLGKTIDKTVKRMEYIPENEILSQLKKRLSLGRKIDYITFAGSGEPTLNSKIGELIKSIKGMTSIPVAILTNGSLLFRESMRSDILNADLVIPSLDAVTQEIFEIINRPHPSLNIDKIISGLINFREEFKGRLWLEVMLVKGINDNLDHIKKMKSVIERIKPDRIQLNTVVRPPTEKFASPLSPKELEKIKNVLGDNTQIIAKFESREQIAYIKDVEEAIVTLVKRRPVTLQDISNSLGIHRNEIIKYLSSLERDKKIKSRSYGDRIYYEAGTLN
jgi:wyosine [tRNA(Phe)-imidazoG37] synthetase (radical SAM superfamily)